MPTAKDIAEDPRVTAWARILSIATPVIATLAIGVVGWILQGQAAERVKLDGRVTTLEQNVNTLGSRVSVLESTSTANKANRDKQINDINLRIDQNQNSVEAKLDKIGDTLTLISNQVSALNATISATSKLRP